MKKLFLTFILCIAAQITFGQTELTEQSPKQPEKYTAHNKGKFFVQFGGNRDSYTKSDIRFYGDDYNFTLYDVAAHDKPKGIHLDYFNPARMTIPQTNLKFGYFFTDKYSIAIGVDHMKYVMTQNQTVEMSGSIQNHSPFDGTYQNDPTILTEDFLKFEHTNGLNYVHTELARQDDISKLIGTNTDVFQLNTVVGASFGFLFPKTDVTLMGEHRHDEFHVAGYGTGLKAGLNLTFFKHFYINTEVKGGYINMPDIRTTDDASDKASQHFGFFQTIFAIGTIWKV